MNIINLKYIIILLILMWSRTVLTVIDTTSNDVLTTDLNNGTTMFNENFSTNKKRYKRYLNFMKGSRISWRVNTKNNILNANTIWAYGYGFRANFPLSDNTPIHQRYQRSFHKHDMFGILVDLLNSHGLDGQACLLKCYCSALLDGNGEWSNGMLFKLLKYTFSLGELEKRHFPYLRPEYCYQLFHSHCPLSFNSISAYTDDI